MNVRRYIGGSVKTRAESRVKGQCPSRDRVDHVLYAYLS